MRNYLVFLALLAASVSSFAAVSIKSKGPQSVEVLSQACTIALSNAPMYLANLNQLDLIQDLRPLIPGFVSEPLSASLNGRAVRPQEDYLNRVSLIVQKRFYPDQIPLEDALQKIKAGPPFSAETLDIIKGSGILRYYNPNTQISPLRQGSIIEVTARQPLENALNLALREIHSNVTLASGDRERLYIAVVDHASAYLAAHHIPHRIMNRSVKRKLNVSALDLFIEVLDYRGHIILQYDPIETLRTLRKQINPNAPDSLRSR